MAAEPPPVPVDVLGELVAREPIFHRPELGTSRADFAAMMTDDFSEVGASGRRYFRDHVLDVLEERRVEPEEDIYAASEFDCRRLGPDVYLLRYVLAQGDRITRRATVWERTSGEWRAIYHQGTVVAGASEALSEAERILESVRSVLVVDWPSPEVPDTLVGAGCAVVAKGGPDQDSYAARELLDGRVVVRPVGRPRHVDLVFCHRPLDEFPAIVALAKELGASCVWSQSGRASDGGRDPRGCWVSAETSQAARRIVESAGLRFIDDVYIVDALRR